MGMKPNTNWVNLGKLLNYSGSLFVLCETMIILAIYLRGLRQGL